jgi:hypothetical protein
LEILIKKSVSSHEKIKKITFEWINMFLNRYKQLFIQSMNVDNSHNNRNHSFSNVSKYLLNKIEFKDSSRSIDFSIANEEFNTNIKNLKEKDLINNNSNNNKNKNYMDNENDNDNDYIDSENDLSLEIHNKKNEINNKDDKDEEKNIDKDKEKDREKDKDKEKEKDKDKNEEISNLNINLNQIENSSGINSRKSIFQIHIQEIKENKENILDKITFIVLDLGRENEKRKIPFYLFPEILELLINNYDNEIENIIDENILKISEECNETLHSIVELYNDDNYSNIKLFVEILKKFFNTKNDEILDNILTWISKLFTKFQEKMFVNIDDFIDKFTYLLNKDNEIIFNLVLNILCEIAKYKDGYIEIIIRQILDKLSKNINLLENRAKKIIKNFCNIIDIDRVFLSFAEELKNIKVIFEIFMFIFQFLLVFNLFVILILSYFILFYIYFVFILYLI